MAESLSSVLNHLDRAPRRPSVSPKARAPVTVAQAASAFATVAGGLGGVFGGVMGLPGYEGNASSRSQLPRGGVVNIRS